MRRDFAQQTAVMRLVGYVEGVCGQGLLSNDIESNLLQRAEALLEAFGLEASSTARKFQEHHNG